MDGYSDDDLELTMIRERARARGRQSRPKREHDTRRNLRQWTSLNAVAHRKLALGGARPSALIKVLARMVGDNDARRVSYLELEPRGEKPREAAAITAPAVAPMAACAVNQQAAIVANASPRASRGVRTNDVVKILRKV